jgi:double-stranded uracil-DNA glycosylase
VQPTSPPTRDEVAAAGGALLPDLLAPGLLVWFVGINPSLYSAATGHHFARPGNRFWPALRLAGWTPRLLHPSEQGELPSYGAGITNLVPRATATAAELTPAEYVAGAAALRSKLLRWQPRAVAFLGVTAYRAGFGDRHASIGRQPGSVVDGVDTWVLPNPSGLNAHFQLPELARLYAELRVSLAAAPSDPPL